MPLAVAVTWQARAGTEERVEAIIAEMVEVTRREPGCLMYQPHRSMEKAGVYFIYEQFVDEAAFTAHLESEYYKRLILDEAVTLLDHRERSLYTTADRYDEGSLSRNLLPGEARAAARGNLPEGALPAPEGPR